MPADPSTPDSDAITIDEATAVRLTTLCGKTLGKYAALGEPVGRLRVGRRVLFLRSALERWLASKVQQPAPPPAPNLRLAQPAR